MFRHAVQFHQQWHKKGRYTYTGSTAIATLLCRNEGGTDMFRLFDDDQTGYVTVKNLAKVATELGEALTAEELNEMILGADSSHQGKVSLDDFYSLMVRRSFP
eukprot:g20774.t1